MQKTIMGIDIETVPQREYAELSPTVKEWVDKKLLKINASKEEEDVWDYNKLASLDGDLGKVICISMGLYDEETDSIRLKSVIHKDEEAVLTGFNDVIENFRGDYLHYNGLSFDIPFLLQRYANNRIEEADGRLNTLARYRTSPHFDLMQIWANWDYTKVKPLNVLANIVEMPNPKDELDGSMVFQYFKDGKLDAIKQYCEFDTATVMNLYRRLIEKQPVIPLERYEFSG